MVSTPTVRPTHLPSHRGALLRGLVLTAVAMLLTLLAVTPAHGHAHLLETSPEDGAELDAPPTEVVLTFDEAVDPAGDALVLTDGDGTAHDLEAAVGPDTGQISAEVPAGAAAGQHRLAWRIVAADGHVQEGEVAYTVAAPAPDADQAQEAGTDAGADLGDEPADAGADLGDEPADEDAGDEDAEVDQGLDVEATGAPAESDGGAGWLIAVAVLVVAAIVAGVLVLGGRRRSSGQEVA